MSVSTQCPCPHGHSAFLRTTGPTRNFFRFRRVSHRGPCGALSVEKRRHFRPRSISLRGPCGACLGEKTALDVVSNFYLYLMAIRTRHQTTENTWFITFTCFNWLPLFDVTNSYHLVYKWLKLIDQKYQVKTNGFVIMPNHVHLLLYLTQPDVDLNILISNAKRFMAYELIERLKDKKRYDLLEILSSSCTEKERAKGQLHKGFKPSFDAKPVYTLEFLYQKLDYIYTITR